MCNIQHTGNVTLGIDGEYREYINSTDGWWVDRNHGLNHNYSMTVFKGKPHTFYIYLGLRNYRAEDILVYMGRDGYMTRVQKRMREIIPILDKNILLDKQIHEWKKEHISYYFDKDFNIIGHGYDNLIINEFNIDHDKHEFLYNYYNEKPLRDINKLKYEYYPKNEYLYTYDIGSWGYSSTGTPDNELKQICKQKIIEESRQI